MPWNARAGMREGPPSLLDGALVSVDRYLRVGALTHHPVVTNEYDNTYCNVCHELRTNSVSALYPAPPRMGNLGPAPLSNLQLEFLAYNLLSSANSPGNLPARAHHLADGWNTG
jgi:hypothetical protein